MGFDISKDLQKQLQGAIKNIEKQTQTLANQTAKAVLNRNKSFYTSKLRSLIDSEFYQRYGESDYYERTYQFRKLAHCVPHTEGNNFSLEIWFDTDNVIVYEPSRKGQLYSYAYSWGENKGEYVGEDFVNELYGGFLERTDILEKFMEWFEDDFQTKFEVLFNQRISRLNK